MRKKRWSIVVGALCWAVFRVASANAGVLYEKEFKINRLNFLCLTNQAIAVDTAQPAKLVITRRTPTQKIQTGYLFLNGRMIFLHDFLRGPALVFEKDVLLKTRNHLQLFMVGASNAAISIALVSQTALVVEPPSVALSATPTSITAGESAALNWSTAGADTVTISPDIGTVSNSGTMAIRPDQTTAYTLVADGPGGRTTAQTTVTVVQGIRLTIDSPRPGDVIESGAVTVQGSFKNGAGVETGITVNGIVALVSNGRFAANQVPLEDGANSLTIQAVDATGQKAEERIDLMADTSRPRIHVRATAVSGLAPLDTDLAIEAPGELRQSRVTVDGPADAQIIRNELDHYTLILDTPGLYTATVTAVNTQNNTYSETIVLQVLDYTAFNTLLQKKWDDMKSELARGDIEAILTHYSTETRALHAEIFTALADQLPAIAAEMRDIELVSVENGFATCHLARSEVHQSQSYEITYDVYFTCGVDGLWKIARF